MNQFENALLNPEPQPVTCYLQEEDPPEDHDLQHYSAVCGRCYAALDDMHKATIGRLLDTLILALPYVEMAEHDNGYKPGAVAKMVSQIRAAIAKAEGVE